MRTGRKLRDKKGRVTRTGRGKQYQYEFAMLKKGTERLERWFNG